MTLDSAPTVTVADIALAFITPATIIGMAQQGTTLTAVNGTLNDSDVAVTVYQWQSSSNGGGTWSNISGATSQTYTPVSADKGHLLRVVETATDADGGPTKTSTGAATGAVAYVAFTPATANLLNLEQNLASGTPVGTFTETAGVARHTYTYTLGGSGAFAVNPSNGALATNASLSGPSVYALTVQVTDTTQSVRSTPVPFDVVVETGSPDIVNLTTGASNLGINPSTPTLIYGLGGNDTLSASGMTAPVWFVGGAGGEVAATPTSTPRPASRPPAQATSMSSRTSTWRWTSWTFQGSALRLSSSRPN